MNRLLAAALLVAGLVSAGTAQAQKAKMTIATGVDPSLGTFYVAKVGGFFDKHGLDVQLNTGPSGSAMVAFLVQNQVQAVLAAEQAGIQNFNLDNNVVVAAQAMQMLRYFGVVARNIDSVEGLKGKKIGVSLGSASEVFWRAFVEKLNLNPRDYTIVNVDPPEMLAAIQRGNIDAFSAWEPWLTRTTQAVPGTKIVRDNEGIINPRNFVYINKGWAAQNPEAAVAFMRALVDATQLLRSNPDEAAKHISTFLKMDAALTRELIGKVNFDLYLDQSSIDHLKRIEAQLQEGGKLAKPIDWEKFIYADVFRKVQPDRVSFTLPK
ncbi:MAG: ABC transporter substrate-binding protein [Acidobacteria bacterium]|nr:ABC transporter substrate-binding protein [Acidobacteriota bacterium]